MKSKNLLLTVIFAFVFVLIKAQTTDNWQPVLLSTNGTSSFDGIDAYYNLTTCNNVEVVLVELINHNNYAVKAGWKDWMVTTDDQQLPKNTVQDSITLRPNSTVQGDCQNNATQLVFRLSDFGTDAKNFKSFITSNFDFVIIH